MSKRASGANAKRSTVRARVEHVFARQKDQMGLLIRTIDKRARRSEDHTRQPRLQYRPADLPRATPRHGITASGERAFRLSEAKSCLKAATHRAGCCLFAPIAPRRHVDVGAQIGQSLTCATAPKRDPIPRRSSRASASASIFSENIKSVSWRAVAPPLASRRDRKPTTTAVSGTSAVRLQLNSAKPDAAVKGEASCISISRPNRHTQASVLYIGLPCCLSLSGCAMSVGARDGSKLVRAERWSLRVPVPFAT